jgi:hypothetical protein
VPELVELEERGTRIVAHARLGSGAGEDGADIFQVLTMRGGRIVDIQDCRDRAGALKLATRGGPASPA